jgi:plastocyanin
MALVALGQFFSTGVAQGASEIPTPIVVTSIVRYSSSGSPSTITSTPTSSREAQVHTIKAGAGGFSFTPQQTQVPPGDIVTFEFVFTFERWKEG